MQDSQDHPRRVHGVDFSGAANAGKKIWITSGVIEDCALRIEDCRRAEALPRSRKDRDQCLTALRDFIRREHASVFGLDFPFALPRELIKENSWEDFVLSFPDRYPNPEEFRKTCRAGAHNRELRRVTDKESDTPFSPYNLRLYRQTYFGIRDVLGPLVQDHLVCVLPMQSVLPGRPWILEVCPASTLKRQNLYKPYKGGSKKHYAARMRILEALEGTGVLPVPEPTLRPSILDNRDGDALDSVIAAFATFRALRNPACNENYALEGYVFV